MNNEGEAEEAKHRKLRSDPLNLRMAAAATRKWLSVSQAAVSLIHRRPPCLRPARSRKDRDAGQLPGPVASAAAVARAPIRPAHIRSDNGPEFIAKVIRAWLSGAGLGTLYIAPGAPWENGYAG